MEGIAYDIDEDCFGGIVVSGPKGSVYFQGDDADIFRENWRNVLFIWARVYAIRKDGTIKYRKRFGPFTSYQQHIDYICSQYDDVMKEEETK